MGFSSSQYQFSEGAGSLPESVYIVRENAVTVSSTFTVTVVLQTTSTASDSKFFTGAMQFPTGLYRVTEGIKGH